MHSNNRWALVLAGIIGPLGVSAVRAQELSVSHQVPAETARLPIVDGVATFDAISHTTLHAALVSWTEGGMTFTCGDGGFFARSYFIPPGLTDPNFYYDVPVYSRYGIRQADGESFAALQFDTANAGGGVWNYIWMTVLLDGQVLGEFHLDVPMQTLAPRTNRVTISGMFDEVLLFSDSSSNVRDRHPMPADRVLNQLVLDNVSFTSVPEPGFALGGVVVAAPVVFARRRRSRR